MALKYPAFRNSMDQSPILTMTAIMSFLPMQDCSCRAVENARMPSKWAREWLHYQGVVSGVSVILEVKMCC